MIHEHNNINLTCLAQSGNFYDFDVVVIGSGLAGLYYCLQLVQYKPKIKIALISKTELLECNSRYAQGGIAAVISGNDSCSNHINDTLKAGDGLCYQPIVAEIINQAATIIEDLLGYNLKFTKNQLGEFNLAQEGGHSHRRIFNCGDQTGLTILQNLMELIKLNSQIQCFEHHIAVNLITNYYPHRIDIQGEVIGAYILDCHTNKIHTFKSNCLILATGGAGKTYRYTTNSMIATGDGVAMAYRAGARIGNMEFYQFHPTLLHHYTVNNFLISEAVRGEGGVLRNAETNVRFMQHYAPQQMELATRDIVSRAIFNEIEQTQSSYVYLDITHKSKTFLQQRFPQIYNTLLAIGIEMSQDMIPVVPAAHYQCGGILTDIYGCTDLKRLYAIGEVAFTGLHGANRLASNSLLEACVMARNAAKCSVVDIENSSPVYGDLVSWNSPGEINIRRASQINSHWRGLRGEMTSYAGIVRTEDGLQDLLQLILRRKKSIEEYYWRHYITRDFIELRNIILNAELIVTSALARRESRGGHYREDFPQKHQQAIESIVRLTTPQTLFI